MLIAYFMRMYVSFAPSMILYVRYFSVSLTLKMFGVRRGAHVDPLYMGDNTAAAFRAIGYWDPQYPVHVYRNHPIFSNKCNETEQVFNKFNEIVRRHKKTVVLANASWLMLIGGFILFIYIQVDHSIWEMMGYNVLAYILVPMVAMFGVRFVCGSLSLSLPKIHTHTHARILL